MESHEIFFTCILDLSISAELVAFGQSAQCYRLYRSAMQDTL